MAYSPFAPNFRSAEKYHPICHDRCKAQ